MVDEAVSLAEVLLYHQLSGVGLVPTNLDLSGAEVELLSNPFGNNVILRSKVELIRDRVDYVLIDPPPSLGLLTIHALTAADGVIVPVQTHYLAYHGLQLLQQTVAKVKKRANPGLAVIGVVPTFFDSRVRHHSEVLAELRKNYASVLIDVPIPVRVSLADAMVAGKSIHEFDASSDIAKLYARIAEGMDHG
jgi:chromosome partitioning protein